MTIFTACANIDKNTVTSYVIVSDYMVHGKHQVVTFPNRIILDVNKEHTGVELILFFSDGPQVNLSSDICSKI